MPIFDFGLILNPTTTSYPMIFLGRRRLWNENPPKQKGSEQISKYTSMRTDLGNTYFFHETIFLKNQSDIERYWEFFFHANNRDEANSFGQGSFFAIWFHSKHIHDLGNIYVHSNISYARGFIPSNTPPPVQTNGFFSSNYNIDVKIWWKNIRKITSEKKTENRIWIFHPAAELVQINTNKEPIFLPGERLNGCPVSFSKNGDLSSILSIISWIFHFHECPIWVLVFLVGIFFSQEH